MTLAINTEEPLGAALAAKMVELVPDAIAAKAAPTGRGSARDLRKGRWSGAHQAYLITTVTHRRERLFEQPVCARAVIHALRHATEQGFARTHAFVVMPDHLQWLMSLGEEIGLSATVGRVKGTSARCINSVLNRTGLAAWQPGFHDHALRTEENVRGIARYVVANPLRAGLVAQMGDYSWWVAEW
jgi:REP element-mobilizing transposase RayT